MHLIKTSLDMIILSLFNATHRELGKMSSHIFILHGYPTSQLLNFAILLYGHNVQQLQIIALPPK